MPEFRVEKGLARQALPPNLWQEVDVEDSEQFLEMLVDVCALWPTRPAFNVLESYFRKICPLSLIDELSDSMIRLEARAERYGDSFIPAYKEMVLQEDGSFEIIEKVPEFVLEAFDAIASGRNDYYKMKEESRKTEQPSSKKGRR